MPIPINDVLGWLIMARGDNVATVESMAEALVTIIKQFSMTKTAIETETEAGREAR